MTDRPGRYAHTAECRDDYCVHPIQCETDGICPPSPGGEVAARIAWSDIAAMYEKVKDWPPLESLKLTQAQMAWLRERIPTQPYDSYRFSVNPLLGMPIHIVETYQESTPHLKDWPGWPGESR